MDGQAIISVSAAVVALTQLVKWSGLPDKVGPLAVLALSAAGVALWAYTQDSFARNLLFDYFAGWIAVATSAAGVFGFTRAAANAVISAKPPPSGGAGSHATTP
jgi:hypothetical protein